MARARERQADSLRRALKERDEALAFQAATDGILTAISRSTSDAKPVFDAIVRSVPRLFGTRYVAVFLVQGDELHLAASRADVEFERRHGPVFRRFRDAFPQPVDWKGFTGKALRSGKVSQIAPIIGNPKATPQAVQLAKEFGYNAMLVAPLVRDGKTIGAIGTTRPEAKLFDARELALFKRFAAQAVIAIENARLFNETKEALEQQTATTNILHVISRSVTDLAPVFEAILESAITLCEGNVAALWQYDGNRLCFAAGKRVSPEATAHYRSHPLTLGTYNPTPQAALERRTLHVLDVFAERTYRPLIPREIFTSGPHAPTVLAVPLLRENDLLGVVTIWRYHKRFFTDKQVAMVNTFAAQAVIAIENVRLFNETKEALEQQTTTAGVLRVIAGSPTDLKPVMHAVVERAARLLEAEHALIGQADGEGIHWLAAYGCPVPDGTRSITRELPSGRAILDLQTTQIEDIGQIERDSLLERSYGQFGVRTICATPLIREGRAVGVILLRRTQVRPFTEKQMSLLRTFADQAVIAIENARLFNETKEALEQQTATSQILGVISSSPTDLAPVFDAILASAMQLCEAHLGIFNFYDGEWLRTVAQRGGNPQFAKWLLERGSIKPDGGMTYQAITERRAVQIADVREAPGYREGKPNISKFVDLGGVRTFLAVPLLKEGAVVGTIGIYRPEVRPFTDKQIALVSTFASQAVIAIENARLFNETKEALERQTATAEILKVISSSPTATQPVFESIVHKCHALYQDSRVALLLIDDGRLITRASTGHAFEPVPIDRESGLGACVLEARTIHLPDLEAAAEQYPRLRQLGIKHGYRSGIYAPLMREGRAVGGISVLRRAAGAFSEKDVALLTTFADQAVIAIENARLFNETKEALEQQTASNEILGVISSSPTDLRPVFDAILESATRLCDAHLGVLNLFEGEMCRTVAQRGGSPEFAKWVLERGVFKPAAAMARILADRRPFHVPDAREGPGHKARDPNAMKFVELGGVRTYLAVPLLKEGAVIGSINIFRPDIRPFTDKQIALVSTFADQAVIAIENVRLFNELQSSNATLREALGQQTATGEILKVIASATSEVQPVFDTIVRNAALLGNAAVGFLISYDGTAMQLAAQYNVDPEGESIYRPAFPRPAARDTMTGRSILDRAVINLADIQSSDFGEGAKERARRAGYRSALVVPMLRSGVPIGVLNIQRREAGAFPDSYVALLKTFADQAVIAIENVRLFNETREALEQQKAMSEILRTISSSPTDLQPVFDTILAHAIRLGEGSNAVLWRYGDGKLRFAAEKNCTPQGILAVKDNPLELGDYNPTPQAGLERRTVHVLNVFEEPRYRPLVPLTPGSRGSAPTVLAVPLLKDDELLGVVSIWRREPRLFTDKQVAMVETFAAQAVIAIENVRLFNETKEALERQTATADVLKVISGSPTDVQPVLDSIAERATLLCHAKAGFVTRFDGKLLHLAALYGAAAESVDAIRAMHPTDPASGGSIAARVVHAGVPVQVPDVLADPGYAYKGAAQAAGYRSVLGVPLTREGQIAGVIVVVRAEPGLFPQKQVQVLQTFADQAVIAIENVRLFNETKEALERQTATAEILKVISASPTDVQPVFDIIGRLSEKLCQAEISVVSQFDGELIQLKALHGVAKSGVETVRRVFPLRPDEESVTARAFRSSKVVHVADVLADPRYAQKDTAKAGGWRSALGVPMVREEQVIGVIFVARKTPGFFSDNQVELLKAFADQAVIAIENVRLFNETKEALERQTATADILRVISGSPTDTRPVFDVIAKSGLRLFGGLNVAILLRREKEFVLAGYSGPMEDLPEQVRTAPLDPEKNFPSRAILEGKVLNVTDWEGGDVPEHERLVARSLGIKSGLMVPLLRQGEGIGAIAVLRATEGPFIDNDIALLQSFADQAVIAIENVRLFNETKEALERQTATAEILKVISASPSDVQPVFDAVAENAARVCGVDDVAILRTEGGDLRRVAHYGSVPVSPDSLVPVPPGSVNERVLSERRTLHIPDTAAPSFAREFPGSQFPAVGVRSLLATPLVHDGVAVGVIHLRRSEPRPFTDKQIALLETFADQAVIAIENVRLFNETREALERQTATGEILASMSGSMTDTKPVFDAIVRNLLRLFGSSYAVVSLRRGQFFELAGFRGEPGFERLEELYPIPVDEHSILGEVVTARHVKRYAPVVGNSAVPRRTAEIAERFGFNSIMSAPMMWKGEAIGTIIAARRQALPFDDKQVALIQSFADQAVIAIENVRLFKELQERTEALTKSVGQLTALGDVGRAISSTLELDEVLRTIVQRAVQLAELDGGSIWEFDERDERFHLRAAESIGEQILDVYRKSPIRLGEGALGRAGATRKPVVVEDVLDESYRSRVRELLIRSGARALLAVPLLSEDRLLGALVVNRKSPGPFAPEAIELLKTFATQSAVAIQNARLFREIEEKGRQLEEASRHKSQFLASMSHELRTPLNAILGFNEMILGQVYGEVPSDMQEPLEDIQKSGKHLLRLINNVLDLAKIEAGKMELALADYSVQDTVESVRSTLRPLAEAKGLELVVSVPEDIPLAYGDGGRLTQCLMNLAGNSLKFTKEGRVEIAVEAENGCLRWRVSDTGIGIPPDKIPTLFSEFKQTDATIASEYGGTGLGLSITKKFVEMHGGRIWVESEPGKGSVFTVEIPLRVTAPA